jgi:hypothetical protein
MAVFTAIGASIFGAGTFLAGLTAAGLQVAAGIALSAIGRAMSGDGQGQKFGVQGKLQAGEDVPRSIAFGWSCTAGSLAWHGTFGPGGTMSARVIALYDLPIREFRYPIVEGVDCTVLTGEAHTDYGWPVSEFRKDGQDHLWIKFYDGTQTAADPFLVGAFGADPDRPYEDTRIGTGVPYVIVFARAPERSDEGEKPLFQGVPSLKFVTYGTRWYNPAADTTVGGSGAHRWDNPATWGGDGDFNAIVQLYNLFRGIRYDGQWLYGMQATSAARLPIVNWIAGINAAQAGIDGPSGTEPTYRAGGEVQVGAQVATTAEALLTAANAKAIENGGAYSVVVGPPGAAVAAFTDGDILSTEEQTFAPFLALSDMVNALHASWPNPAEGWGPKKHVLLRPELEPLAGNRRLAAPVSLDMVPYPGQVQRLTLSAMLEALRARRHTFVLGPEFRGLEPGDVVAWTSIRNGYAGKLFRVDGVIYKSNLDVIVDLTEVDPSDYDWDQEADYTPVIDGSLTLVGPRPMPMTGWQVFPATIEDELGRARRPSIEVWAGSNIPNVQRVRVQVRVGDDSGQLIFDSDSQPYATPWKWILQGQFPPNTACVVRGIFVGPEAAEWSGWLSVTTPDVKLGALDVVYGDIDLDDLSEQIEGYFDWIGTNVRQLLEQAQALATSAADEVLGNYSDHQQIRRELTLTAENVTASYLEAITVAVGPGSAIVSRIESLEVAVEEDIATAVDLLQTQIDTVDGQVTANANAITLLSAEVDGVAASITIRAEAVSGGSGGWSRYGIYLAAADDEAAFFIEVNGTDSRAVYVVDQFIVSSSSTLATPFIFDGSAIRVANAFVGTASIQDAAITTAKIGDAQITSAKIGNAQITSAKIDNLAVGTLKLADGAVTVGLSAASASTTFAYGTPRNTSITFGSFVAGSIVINGQINIPEYGIPAGALAKLNLYRNGSFIRSKQIPWRWDSVPDDYYIGDGYVDITYVDLPPSAGSYTYLLEIELYTSIGVSIPYNNMRISGAYAMK